MEIGIIDADLIGRKNHRFPNLACEKISGYWKDHGAKVTLLKNYNSIQNYDCVYISKVFTDTPVPAGLKESEKLKMGGTGFFYDSAPALPYEIEHHFPDYHLYDQWIQEQIQNGEKQSNFNFYQGWAIGFLTRGCFRKCPFCVNQKYNSVIKHSPLSEFYDGTQKKICLLDDNFFGYYKWKELLTELIEINKPICFKQGLDERLLTEDKCKILFSAKYYKEFTFAFDNIEDYDLIKNKLQMIRKYYTKDNIKFYVLVGFKSTDYADILNAFKRIRLLQQYRCLPYIMKYRSPIDSPYESSIYRDMYIQLSNWCNQPGIFKKKSFRQFCEMIQGRAKTNNPTVATRVLNYFEKNHSELVAQYFDYKFGDD